MMNRSQRKTNREVRNACGLEALETRVLPSAAVTMAAPTSLTAAASSTTAVVLHWQDANNAATGYEVLRSTNGTTFTLLSKGTSATATTYTDTSAASGHQYFYEVEAYNKTTTTAPTAAASAVTPLAAPTGLTATLSGVSINLAWTDHDTNATGYTILRSTNNKTFTAIATVSGSTAKTYTDSTTGWGTTYYYEVIATNAIAASVASNTASKATPGAGVTITTEYGDELVVNMTGADDAISILENGSTLTINADGSTYTDPTEAAGLFVYTRGGADKINLAQSLTAQTTLETIDGAVTTITSAASDVISWIDSTDVYTGTGTVHRVASFAGGVSKATGAALANPSDSGKTIKVTASLFGTGPVAGDVNQGEAGDCYFLSTLAGFAGQNPNVLVNSAVDMGDGTYVVQFMKGNTPTYVRVNNSFSAGPFEGLEYAHPGASGDIWAMVMEKAFAYFRTGKNTYASINSGWMGEVYSDLGVSNSSFAATSYTDSSFFSMVSTDLTDGLPVTLGTSNSPPNLVGDHAYTLVSAYVSNGVNEYMVRNPWGVQGDAVENAQGYATLTFAQIKANFVDGCQA